MKKRWAIRLGLLLPLLIAGVFVFPTSRLVLLGWLRGESFYQGRPTSYWSLELSPWQYGGTSQETLKPMFSRAPGFWDVLKKSLGFGQSVQSPAMMEGDPDAANVLIELLGDEHANVREMAAVGLGEFGPEAERAVPALCRVVKEDNDNDVAEAAWVALLGINPKAADEAMKARNAKK